MPDVRCERLVVSGEHFIGGARIASHDTLEVCSVGASEYAGAILPGFIGPHARTCGSAIC